MKVRGKIWGLVLVLLLVFSNTAISNGAEDEFGYKIVKSGEEFWKLVFTTEGNSYEVLSSTVRAGGCLIYFAGKDFTHHRDMMIDNIKELKVIKDEDNRKVVKVYFLLQDLEGKRVPDYSLEVSLEIRKGLPSLEMYSKLRYKGEERALTGLNWGISDGFKYYAIPQKNEVKNYALPQKIGKFTRTKIGVCPWIYAHGGKGEGLGVITSSLLGKGEDYIFVNSIPQKKRLGKNESMDVFILVCPVKGYKPIASLYERVKNIDWDIDKW